MVQPWPELDPALMAPHAEREELRGVVRDLLGKHADHEQIHAAADTGPGYSVELWRRLSGEFEINRLAVPEALGGAGFGLQELCVVLEEAGAALLPEPLLSSAVIGCQALIGADDPAGIEDLLGPALDGDLLVTVSLSAEPLRAELLPGSGSSSGPGTDGRWRITGERARVLAGATADLLVVDAVDDAGEARLFVVRIGAEGAMGIGIEPRATMDLTRRQARIRLDGAPARVLVGPERVAEAVTHLDLLARAAVAAEHTGIVGELLERTVEYVEQREQFGRRIGSFQAIKHRLADLLVDRERARSAARYAAAALDEDPVGAALPVAIASAVCADAAVRTAHEAVQLHGGIGFTWEHRAHYYLRRVLGDEGLFGGSRQQRVSIADLVGV